MGWFRRKRATCPTQISGLQHDLLAGQSVETLWHTQPHLRTVVDFIARNVAQLGVHSYFRQAGESRIRDRDSTLASVLADPGDGLTHYDLIYALVADLALYDRAYWWLWIDNGTPRLRRLSPSWVTPERDPILPYKVSTYTVQLGAERIELSGESVIDFSGYTPADHRGGSAAIESLRAVMAEHAEAMKFRLQMWSNGGKFSSVLERPATAPEWSDTARERFKRGFRESFTGHGENAGGTPLLEDGMQLKRIDHPAADSQYVEGVRLAMSTVAAAFHVSPVLVGVLDNANYSNVREYRQMLYRDTLGPTLARIEGRLNAELVPAVGLDPREAYAEFNVEAALRGSFEEQSTALQTAVGRPWLSPDEARARLNLPTVGGDAAGLALPLNLTVGQRTEDPPKSIRWP